MKIFKLENNHLKELSNNNNILNKIISSTPIVSDLIKKLTDKAIFIMTTDDTEFVYLADKFPAADELSEKTSDKLCFHVAQFRKIKGRRIPGKWFSQNEAIQAIISYHKRFTANK